MLDELLALGLSEEEQLAAALQASLSSGVEVATSPLPSVQVAAQQAASEPEPEDPPPSPQQALAAVLVGPPLEGYALDNILAGESRWVILDGLHSDPPVPLTVSAADRDTRLARARQAGVDAQRKLNRELRYLPRTPRLRGEAARRACFVVLQAAPAHPAAVGFRAGAYDSVAGYVCTNGRISGRALFHGFATVEEAAAYWSGSGREQPWPLLEPFRA